MRTPAASAIVARSAGELRKTFALSQFVARHLVQGGVAPAVALATQAGKDVARPFVDAARGKRQLRAGLAELRERAAGAARYGRQIDELGAELFGSATYAGERRLAENEFYTLSYLPPTGPPGARRPALFHVGGFLPFSDRIFRLLPEANLFAPLLAAGFPVYAMELRGDRAVLRDASGVTLERVIDTIDAMSDIACGHNRGERMVIEGYCGLALPTLAYLAALPAAAEAKFGLAMLLVAPVDGRRCAALAEMVSRVPDTVLFGRYVVSELTGRGYVAGSQLRAGIDVPLDTFFFKSNLGRFLTGWTRRKLHRARRVGDLSAGQRKELAGAYWISRHNCDRFPLPVSLMRVAGEMWRAGVEDDGVLPARYRGRQLGLEAIAQGTRLRVVGIYGGEDKVIREDTAHPLHAQLGERYTHVVHRDAGHVSYVFSSEIWDPSHPKALDPHPVRLIEELFQA